MEKQAILAAIIDSSEDAIISKTIEGYITSWNHAAERMFGYREEEVIGKHISILIPKDRLDEEDMIIDHIRHGQRVQHFRTLRLKKDGHLLPISLTVSPVKGSDGTIIGASKIARDISDQVRAEVETKQHLENLELLISVGKTISEKLDLESILQKLTDITTRLTGAELGAFFYNMIDDKGEHSLLFTLSGAPWETFEKFGMSLNTAVFQKTFSGEGIVRAGNTMAVPVSSPSGEVIGGLFFAHSQPGMFTQEHEKLLTGIASQAAVAIENAKLYEEVKTLNTRKDEFIGVAGHELRTPITTIKGYLQLLVGHTPEGLTKDFIEKALRQVNKLNRLITDLLDVTRIHAGKLDYTISRCSLIGLVKECIETVRQIHTSHAIESKLPDDDLIVMVDSTKIEQVLINFLINAIKYSPGQNKIFVQVTREAGQAVVSIRDLGMGIPKQDLINIFHRYYRVNNSQHVIAGLGIGLYISKEIIDRHSGSIWVESEEGKGSTFYFALPLA
ncbi:MAG TPA: PAS domain S-box protein [Puia sp.]|nr:PAS domain S-box protein [Puia sp.]